MQWTMQISFFFGMGNLLTVEPLPPPWSVFFLMPLLPIRLRGVKIGNISAVHRIHVHSVHCWHAHAE